MRSVTSALQSIPAGRARRAEILANPPSRHKLKGMRVRRLVIASTLVVAAACGGRIKSGDGAAGVTALPVCAGSTATAPAMPACGQELTSCDPLHPQGLPVGTCSEGAACDVVVRAECACPDEQGGRYPWRCSCDGGSWQCTLDPPEGRACGNSCLTDAGPGDGGGFCPGPKAVALPGPRLTTRAALGTGACAGRTLGSVIDAIRAANPVLAGVTTLYDPNSLTSDGSFVHAFAVPDGFAIAFKVGGGDCPAGCTENEYWYFRTDASCAPLQVGHYHPTYGSGCVTVDGTPLWATPTPIDPVNICAADTSAQDISGTYSVCATGNQSACATSKNAGPPVQLNTNLKLVIAQLPDDRSKGTVTVSGTGHPLIDGVPLEATFKRRRFDVTRSFSNLPATCMNEWQFSMQLDFEGGTPGHLQFFEFHTVDCSGTGGGGDYCKGQIWLDVYAP